MKKQVAITPYQAPVHPMQNAIAEFERKLRDNSIKFDINKMNAQSELELSAWKNMLKGYQAVKGKRLMNSNTNCQLYSISYEWIALGFTVINDCLLNSEDVSTLPDPEAIALSSVRKQLLSAAKLLVPLEYTSRMHNGMSSINITTGNIINKRQSTTSEERSKEGAINKYILAITIVFLLGVINKLMSKSNHNDHLTIIQSLMQLQDGSTGNHSLAQLSREDMKQVVTTILHLDTNGWVHFDSMCQRMDTSNRGVIQVDQVIKCFLLLHPIAQAMPMNTGTSANDELSCISKAIVSNFTTVFVFHLLQLYGMMGESDGKTGTKDPTESIGKSIYDLLVRFASKVNSFKKYLRKFRKMGQTSGSNSQPQKQSPLLHPPTEGTMSNVSLGSKAQTGDLNNQNTVDHSSSNTHPNDVPMIDVLQSDKSTEELWLENVSLISDVIYTIISQYSYIEGNELIHDYCNYMLTVLKHGGGKYGAGTPYPGLNYEECVTIIELLQPDKLRSTCLSIAKGLQIFVDGVITDPIQALVILIANYYAFAVNAVEAVGSPARGNKDNKDSTTMTTTDTKSLFVYAVLSFSTCVEGTGVDVQELHMRAMIGLPVPVYKPHLMHMGMSHQRDLYPLVCTPLAAYMESSIKHCIRVFLTVMPTVGVLSDVEVSHPEVEELSERKENVGVTFTDDYVPPVIITSPGHPIPPPEPAVIQGVMDLMHNQRLLQLSGYLEYCNKIATKRKKLLQFAINLIQAMKCLCGSDVSTRIQQERHPTLNNIVDIKANAIKIREALEHECKSEQLELINNTKLAQVCVYLTCVFDSNMYMYFNSFVIEFNYINQR